MPNIEATLCIVALIIVCLLPRALASPSEIIRDTERAFFFFFLFLKRFPYAQSKQNMTERIVPAVHNTSARTQFNRLACM